MRVEITKNPGTKIERIPRDAIKPTKKNSNRYLEWKMEMDLQNACIDMMEACSREEILKIWFDNRWHFGHSFIPTEFWSNFENYEKHNVFGTVILEIIPENPEDIKAMNKKLYEGYRIKAYDENMEFEGVSQLLRRWAKEMRTEIQKGKENTPVSLTDYIQTAIDHIWKEVEKYDVNKNINFKFLVDEEMDRIILGKGLIPDNELIEDRFKSLRYGDGFDNRRYFIDYVFMNRIIAHDIAKIILELETGKFFPDTPDMEAPAKKSKSTTDISFKWLSNPKSELPPLYHKMKKAGLIAQETTEKQFTAIFTRQPIEDIKPIEWIKEIVLLAYFIERLISTEIGRPLIQDYGEPWSIAGKCFYHAVMKVDNESLTGARKNYNRNKSGKPKKHNLIDQLF